MLGRNGERQEVGCMWWRQFTEGPVWQPLLLSQIPLTRPELLPPSPFTPFTLSYLLLNIHSRDSETWKKSSSAPPLLTAKYIPQISLHPSSKQRCSCFLPLQYPFLSRPLLVSVCLCVCPAVVFLALCENCSALLIQAGDRLPQAYPSFCSFPDFCQFVQHQFQRSDVTQLLRCNRTNIEQALHSEAPIHTLPQGFTVWSDKWSNQRWYWPHIGEEISGQNVLMAEIPQESLTSLNNTEK